jgi:GMP synthase-like glutamine amidotransferase
VSRRPRAVAMARCLVVQHVEPEGPYGIADALRARGVRVDTCALFGGDTLPGDLSGFDALVVMGGPLSAAGDEGFPTRRGELRLLQEALSRRLPTLGVCLGAQLLAAAAGAPVRAGRAGAEIGWMPVLLSAGASDDPLLGGVGSPLVVLHWHGDTFELPAGARHLARSERYPNQAFRLGPCAWGLQFHLEVDGAAVAAFLAAFGAEAAAAGVPPESVAAATPESLERLASARGTVLGRFAAVVGAQSRIRPASRRRW